MVADFLDSADGLGRGELAEDEADLSVVLHWLVIKGKAYLERVQWDFNNGSASQASQAWLANTSELKGGLEYVRDSIQGC